MISGYHISTKQMILGFLFFILAYFIYHTYHGERGLIAKEQLEQEYAVLSKTFEKVHQERLYLENKITSLGAGDGSIDPDLLTEHAKRMGYIYPDEILITD